MKCTCLRRRSSPTCIGAIPLRFRDARQLFQSRCPFSKWLSLQAFILLVRLSSRYGFTYEIAAMTIIRTGAPSDRTETGKLKTREVDVHIHFTISTLSSTYTSITTTNSSDAAAHLVVTWLRSNGSLRKILGCFRGRLTQRGARTYLNQLGRAWNVEDIWSADRGQCGGVSLGLWNCYANDHWGGLCKGAFCPSLAHCLLLIRFNSSSFYSHSIHRFELIWTAVEINGQGNSTGWKRKPGTVWESQK